MKKFLYRLLNFLLILVGILVLKTALIRPNISNEIYLTKYNDYLSKSADLEFNTLFFGSSRIYRHIDPEQFDSLGTDYKMSSYNLGAPATFSPELYYIYDRFLEDYKNGLVPDSIKYVFIELQRLNNLTLENALSDQGSYWNSLEYLFKSLDQINELKIKKRDKAELVVNYTISFFNNLLSIYPKIVMDQEFLKYLENGFISLEDELQKLNDNHLIERREEFLRDPSKITERAEAIIDVDFEELINKHQTKSLKDDVQELISKSNDLNIKLYFIIPPRQSLGTYSELLPIIKDNSESVLELVSVEEYPELYELKYSFDVGHLNDLGVNLFTKYVFQEFRELETKE